MHFASLRHGLSALLLLCPLAAWTAAAPRALSSPAARSSATAKMLPTLGAWAEGPQQSTWLAPKERAELDLMLRRGEVSEALLTCEELLAAEPTDAPTRSLYARALGMAGRYEQAWRAANTAFSALLGSHGGVHDPALLESAARTVASLALTLGKASEALSALDALRSGAREKGGHQDVRTLWARGQALLALGRREEAFKDLRAGADVARSPKWRTLLSQARCQRALGRLGDAAGTLVAADRAARSADGIEPDVLVELGALYFEFYGEVDDAIGNQHSPRELFDEALSIAPGHEGALLGLFELYRFNWNRHARRPSEILAQVFEHNPDSIRGLLASVSSEIDDGDLRGARKTLGKLEKLAPKRVDVRSERAALAWIEHDTEGAQDLLDELAALDAHNSAPARTVGRHLLELYRFAEGRPFLEAAVGRDGEDFRALRELGRAQANTGDEDAARATLARAAEAAKGRRDAWRDNMRMVLDQMHAADVDYKTANLTFAWRPDAAFVLRTYLVPFYTKAREELAERYGFTPDPARIEVFRRWGDFSVRSTGFEGFPALGVCFGPVVTAVSPLEHDLRGKFSWARTSYHEFTHVIHLGLSHNRCPRWVTEGLATWEEGRRNSAWWRNYRRDLVDARANGDLIKIRRLNGAFRGPRVLFAYYQSGLLCKLLIKEHGFSAMVRFLVAFDRGADLDQALHTVFGTTPEKLDARFLQFVDGIVKDLAIEPRWSAQHTFKRRFQLAARPPEGESERRNWQEGWSEVGWGDLGAGRLVDAQEALRRIKSAGALPPRASFLEGDLELRGGDSERAQESFLAGIAAGGEDFRARMALGAIAMSAGKKEVALENLRAAEKDFPGFQDPSLSAELRIAQVLEGEGDEGGAMAARMRWLAFNAGEDTVRLKVARWLAKNGKDGEAVKLYEQANEVDPFRRSLHLSWARSLFALKRLEETLREAEVGLHIPPELEREQVGGGQSDAGEKQANAPGPDWKAMEIPLLELKAEALLGLGRLEQARSCAQTLLERDQDNQVASRIIAEAQQ